MNDKKASQRWQLFLLCWDISDQLLCWDISDRHPISCVLQCFPHYNNTTWKTNYPGLEFWYTIVKQMLQQRQRKKKNNIIWGRCTILNIGTDQAWFPIKFPAYYLLICCIERSLSEYYHLRIIKKVLKIVFVLRGECHSLWIISLNTPIQTRLRSFCV